MGKSLEQTIHDRRRLLGNPYAYLDELEEIQALHEDRLDLQNPYAHSDELEQLSRFVGRFDGMALTTSRMRQAPIPKKARYADEEVDAAARVVHRLIWDLRADLLPNEKDPIRLLAPEIAFQAIGYDFEVVDSLGEYSFSGVKSRVAGIIDNDHRLVQICGQFPVPVRNFTAAHELGHAVLHETSGLHRDRPLDGPGRARDRTEREAERFASSYLMPPNLVRSRFEQIFGPAPFRLDDETRFALFADRRNGFSSLRELARLLASVSRYNGSDYVPLHEQFRVSKEAMAIRLEELRLIAWS